jgi:hypothetical protein
MKMKHKILSIMGAVAATGVLFLATPMTPPAFAAAQQEMTQRQALEVVITFCANGFREYRRYGTTKFIDEHVAKLPPADRLFVKNICSAYVQGYQDGTEWSRIA